jgi:sortase A
LTEEDKKMTEVEIDGHYYIGCLSIPALELELPIMSDWSYSKLRVSPCRYNGTVRGEDLVLMAHNYKSHFGYISQLKLGDRVVFTDMDGNVTEYKVVGTDVLEPTAVETVTSGDYDLTLFTCTYGGKSRVTVYCDKN